MYWAWERQDILTNIWLGKPEAEKKVFITWKKNIQLVVEEIPYENVEWIPLADGRRKLTAPTIVVIIIIITIIINNKTQPVL